MPDEQKAPGRAGMLSTLLQRDFALLWFGGLASYIGTWAMFVALPLFVFQRTQSTFAAGAVLTAMFAPMLFASVAGVFVDRWDRRRTLIKANVALSLLTVPLLIPALSGSGSTNLWIVYASVVATSVAALVVGPAENALLPTLVGRDRLLTANALNALNDNLARIVGPALGGAVGAFVGFSGVVVLNATSFAIAALLVALIRARQTPATNEDPSGQPEGESGPAALRRIGTEWLAGLRQIRRSRIVIGVFVGTAVMVLGDSMLSALLAPFVDLSYPDPSLAIGLISAARGVGGLLGGVLIGILGRRFAPRSLIASTGVLAGALLAVLVLIPRLSVAIGCLLVLGVVAVAWVASIQTLLQTNVTEQYLGRVFGSYATTSAIMMTLGSALAAASGAGLGVVNLMLVASALYALSGIVTLIAMPRPGLVPASS